MTQTIANICYNRLLSASDVQCYDKSSSLVFIDALQKESDSGCKNSGDTFRSFTKTLVSRLCLSRNSIFLSAVDMYSKATKKQAGTAINYVVCLNHNNRLAVQQLNIVLVNWKWGLKYNASGCFADKHVIITHHAIERLLLRNGNAAIRKDPNTFMYLIKYVLLQIASDMTFSDNEKRSSIDKVAVRGGYFPVIHEDNRIVLTTYVDEGLYTDAQDYIKVMSSETVNDAQKLVRTLNRLQDESGILTVQGKKCDIRNARIFYPTPTGLSPDIYNTSA